MSIENPTMEQGEDMGPNRIDKLPESRLSAVTEARITISNHDLCQVDPAISYEIAGNSNRKHDPRYQTFHNSSYIAGVHYITRNMRCLSVPHRKDINPMTSSKSGPLWLQIDRGPDGAITMATFSDRY